MLEIKITITATEIAAAINNLALSLNGKNPHTVCNQYGGNNHQIENVGTLKMSMGTPPITPAQVNPTPAPVAASARVPGVPLSVTPAQTAAPVAPTAPAVQPVPTGTPSYTLEMLATAGTVLIDAGKMDQLLTLLAKYGVETLTALDPAQYGNFANDLRALGAQI